MIRNITVMASVITALPRPDRTHAKISRAFQQLDNFKPLKKALIPEHCRQPPTPLFLSHSCSLSHSWSLTHTHTDMHADSDSFTHNDRPPTTRWFFNQEKQCHCCRMSTPVQMYALRVLLQMLALSHSIRFSVLMHSI